MAHFDAVLPGKVHRIFYENLVAGPENEIRHLLGYLGLPFEPECLDFHKNDRAVTTPVRSRCESPSMIARWSNGGIMSRGSGR